MLLQLPAHRACRSYSRLVEVGDVWRRRWRWSAQDIAQYILAPTNRRRPARITRNRQHRTLTEKPSTLIRAARHGEFHAPEFRTSPSVNAVELRQSLVHKRVIRVEEFRNGPILFQGVLKEHSGLGLHRVA